MAPPLQSTPSIISMEVDHENEVDSEYRIRVGAVVKYLAIEPRTFDSDTLSKPLQSLPSIPFDGDWTTARLRRGAGSGELELDFSYQSLRGVQNIWHVQVDVLTLERVKQLTAPTFAATCTDGIPGLPSPTDIVIAKIARFEWEIPRIEHETKAYQLLHDRAPGIGPRFLGHLHEGGRVIGFLVEKLHGRSASIDDIDGCRAALQRLHILGLVHGDVNRYNFIVTGAGVKLIDFEAFRQESDLEAQAKELSSLEAELTEETGRGAGFTRVE